MTTSDAADRAPFTPTLTTTDWNEEWKALQVARNHPDDPAEWDARAATFGSKHGSHGEYVGHFLTLANVLPGESVLDMGCGNGALATPLAQAGHPVIAADFSRGMLDAMTADQARKGVTGVTPVHMSWADDWKAHGVGAKCVDVAFASRSIVTDDLRDSFEKLDRTARRRVCITLPCSSSLRVDSRVLEAVGLGGRLGRDFVYAFNILAGMGITPEVSYIPSSRYDTFDTLEEAQAMYTKMVFDAASHVTEPTELSDVEAKLASWLSANLVANERAGEATDDGVPERALRLASPHRVTWAFIAWAPRSA